MKYTMVAINHKKSEDGKPIVRRVLLEYKTRNLDANNFYYSYSGIRLVEKDPYFYDENSSHQYEFTDSTFKLTTNLYDGELLEPRPYHYLKYLPAIEFEADSDEQAIQIFNTKEELR